VLELAVNWEAEKLYGVEGLGPVDTSFDLQSRREQVFDVGQFLRLRFSRHEAGPARHINVRFDPWTARVQRTRN